MPHTTLYDPTDPLNVASLRDDAEIRLAPDGSVTITRPTRQRQTRYTRLSATTRAWIEALAAGRYWPTRINAAHAAIVSSRDTHTSNRIHQAHIARMAAQIANLQRAFTVLGLLDAVGETADEVNVHYDDAGTVKIELAPVHVPQSDAPDAIARDSIARELAGLLRAAAGDDPALHAILDHARFDAATWGGVTISIR